MRGFPNLGVPFKGGIRGYMVGYIGFRVSQN